MISGPARDTRAGLNMWLPTCRPAPGIRPYPRALAWPARRIRGTQVAVDGIKAMHGYQGRMSLGQ